MRYIVFLAVAALCGCAQLANLDNRLPAQPAVQGVGFGDYDAYLYKHGGLAGVPESYPGKRARPGVHGY